MKYFLLLFSTLHDKFDVDTYLEFATEQTWADRNYRSAGFPYKQLDQVFFKARNSSKWVLARVLEMKGMHLQVRNFEVGMWFADHFLTGAKVNSNNWRFYVSV